MEVGPTCSSMGTGWLGAQGSMTKHPGSQRGPHSLVGKSLFLSSQKLRLPFGGRWDLGGSCHPVAIGLGVERGRKGPTKALKGGCGLQRQVPWPETWCLEN